MKQIFLIVMLLINTSLLIGQTQTYDRLSNHGELPKDYTTPSSEKYAQVYEENNLNKSKKTDAQKKFFLEGTYAIDELLRSGYILYNDPIGNYVNRVLDEIVKVNPELKKKNPRVYIFRSTAVNAFAVDQGIIFISIGLLSQIENEAQLALILAHELVHVEESHGLEGFLAATKVDEKLSKNKKVRTKQIDIAELEKNRYSREQEMEADDKGLSYFLNTKYSYKSIQRVFDILRYAYLPYDEVVFEKNILEKISVKIPEDYLLEEVKAINPAEEDEEQSTHPALSRRKEKFDQRLKNKEEDNKLDYIVSEKSFFDVQLKSRTELARLYLERQYLCEAIYTGFLMAKGYGESDFTEEIIGEGLYGFAKFRNNIERKNVSSPYYDDVEGESQQLFYLLKNLSRSELNILAIAYNYHRYLQKPEEEVRSMLVDLFSDLFAINKIESLSSFEKVIPPQIENVDTLKDETSLSKIDKIKKNNKTENEVAWKFLAFSDVLDDETFQNIAEEGFKQGKLLKGEEEYYNTYNSRGRRNLNKLRKKIRKKGRSLGIKKVLVVNPLFIHLRASYKNVQRRYIKSDERRESLKGIINSSAALHDVNVNILDANSLTSSDTEKLNDLMVANEWIDTQLDADEFLYQSYNQKEIKEIAKKYGTSYLMSVVVISTRNADVTKRLFDKKIKSFLLVSVYDIETGRRAYIKSDFSGHYLNDVFLKSEIYDAFYQLSKSN